MSASRLSNVFSLFSEYASRVHGGITLGNSTILLKISWNQKHSVRTTRLHRVNVLNSLFLKKERKKIFFFHFIIFIRFLFQKLSILTFKKCVGHSFKKLKFRNNRLYSEFSVSFPLKPYNFLEALVVRPLPWAPPWWAQCISYWRTVLNMVKVVGLWFASLC